MLLAAVAVVLRRVSLVVLVVALAVLVNPAGQEQAVKVVLAVTLVAPVQVVAVAVHPLLVAIAMVNKAAQAALVRRHLLQDHL